MRRSLGAACVLLTWCAFSGCAPEDVVVATLPSAEPPPGDSVCTTNEDCSPTAFCARAACGDEHGACQVRPLLCEDYGPPTCGCDGVTYWNDCLRMQYGASASTVGSCSSGAAACSDPGGADCPVLGAACAKLTPPNVACEEAVIGACWVLPAECPEMGPSDRFSSCSEALDCVDTCEAIRSGLQYRRDVMRRCGPFPGNPGRD